MDISVVGNRTADAATIINNSGLQVGSTIVVPSEQTTKAIKRLWDLRLFSDIEILVERQVDDGVYLVIKVTEYPRLGSIVIRGNDEFDEDDIRGNIGLVRGQVLKPQAYERIRRRIISDYEEEGYLLATIEFEPLQDSGNLATLYVDIDEGPEVEVESITFSGNSQLDDDDLEDAMENTGTSSWWAFWSSANFQQEKYEEDKDNIIAKYNEMGFLDAEILSDSIWYSDNREEMHIHIDVHEGNQYFVRNVTFSGNTVYSDSAISERLDFERGDVMNMTRFDQNLRGNEEQNDVFSLYLDNGYLRFFAQGEPERVAPDSVDLEINIIENNQFRIGHVEIRGNTKTHDKVIRRVLYTWPGDYFSRAAIIRSIRELATLNYFNPETIRPEPVQTSDSTVKVIYNVEERSSDTFNASVGYSGTFGATGALGLTFNNFNIAEPLSGGAGQILNFQWQFGEASRFRIFQLSFTEPWLFDTPTSVGFSLYDERQNFTFDLRRTGISLNLGRRFRWPDDFVRGDWFLRYQNLAVIDGGRFYDTGDFTQVSLTQVLSRNSLDSPIFPSRGSRIALTTELSGGFLPGSVDYHKHNLGIDWFTPLLRLGDMNRLTLYTGAEYGFVKGFTGDSYIPPIEFYFMGGNGLQIQTQPLRGYEDRSIGPRENGLEIGGTIFARYVSELRFALTLSPMPVYVLAFAEAGNVWLNERFLDPFDLKKSAGFGARLLIQGVGLIGFDYGYGFDDVEPQDGEADGWHFHFQFGRGF
ncbi:MAG: outer membrane protein assembly factor BamA [Ectothiorhodospiraceae bacterium]|nr:outer membrane protein assembly factor BamA [Ectothiorhodospiraceae bacterium]